MAISDEDYLPAQPPHQIPPALRQYLDEELARIAAILNSDVLHLDSLSAAPAKPSNGMLTYADGTNWDPGSGEGFYGYENGAWVKL